jgi:hypothetical protein
VQAAGAFSEEEKRCDLLKRWRKPLYYCWLELANNCWSWCKRLGELACVLVLTAKMGGATG